MSTDNATEIEYDANGFDADNVHRDTGTTFDPNGYDIDGYGESGYSEGGWDRDDLHRDTGTEFDCGGRTRDGDRYNSEGFNSAGFDVAGYNEEGYDEDGYNEENEDRHGCSRCSNGDCEDPDCEQCNPSDSFDDQLEEYGARAPRRLGWRAKNLVDRTLYAGHEIEMYSDDGDFADVEYVLSQINVEYAKNNPQTTSRKCAIAKRDGSLGDSGFEVVTVPLTREQTYGIFTQFKTLGNGRCSAWDNGDEVGHHIHVSRAAIGPLTLGKLGVFMNCEENRAFLEAIACRAANYNSFEDGKKLTDTETAERHSVLNITEQTVEFRMFKSNLYTKAILKNYEFAIAAVRFCEQSPHGFGETDSLMCPLHVSSFRHYVATNRSSYPYLHEFMLTHPAIRGAYRRWSGLPENVTSPSERSPKFALLRAADVSGA